MINWTSDSMVSKLIQLGIQDFRTLDEIKGNLYYNLFEKKMIKQLGRVILMAINHQDI